MYHCHWQKIAWDGISLHDVVIKWKHFPRYWPFVRGIQRSPMNSPHKGQWRGALMFSLICVWINDLVNSRESGDLRRYSGLIKPLLTELMSNCIPEICVDVITKPWPHINADFAKSVFIRKLIWILHNNCTFVNVPGTSISLKPDLETSSCIIVIGRK